MAGLLLRSYLKAISKSVKKGFALSAYRRIKEIEYSVDRILNRIKTKYIEDASEMAELDTIREMALSLRATARSSKADWADIIGTEIATLEAIENIEESNTDEPQADAELNRLLATLPKSLEIQARQLNNRDIVSDETNLFQEELKRNGWLELEGFWDQTFEMDAHALPIGSILHISSDDVGGRIHTLIAHTEDGKSVGVITNACSPPAKYYEFTEALTRALNRSRFHGEYIQKIEMPTRRGRRRNRDERHYFKIKVTAEIGA